MISTYIPYLKGNEQKYLSQCVKENFVSSAGTFVNKFENRFGKIFKFKYNVAVNSGTSALHIALLALGVKENHISRYMQSKLEGEKNIKSNFRSSIILRPSVIFGPEDNFFNAFASFAQFSPFLPFSFKISPGTTSSAAISCQLPSRNTIQDLGTIFINPSRTASAFMSS